MHSNILQRGGATRALRLGVTTSAVGVTLAFMMAGQADAAESTVVQVKPGETLAEIAAEHGLDGDNGWRRIAAATPHIGDPDRILPGQHVRVPAPDPGGGQPAASPETPDAGQDAPAPQPTTAVVQPGDTLAEIAAAHGVGDWRRVFDANPQVANPNVLAVGQELRIPAPGEDLERRPLPQPEPTPSSGSASVQQHANDSREATSSDGGREQVASSSDATPAPSQSQPSTAGGGVWERLAQCESGGNWHANTGNGFYGGLQFTPSSWRAVGGQGLPHQASKGEQIARAQQLQERQGWGAWPACSRQLGLR